MSSSSLASAVARYLPSRPRNLSAFQSAVLWLAPIETPPIAPVRRIACWITGVEVSPRSMTSRPQATSPASARPRSTRPEARGSRPMTTAPGSTNVPKAEAKSSTWPAVSADPTTPRKPTWEMRKDFDACIGLFAFQAQPAERLGHVERARVGRLPRDVLAARRGALAAVEVHSQRLAVLGRSRIDGGQRDLHNPVPDLRGGIDARPVLETRVPLPVGHQAAGRDVDIEIHPLAARRDLEFLIAVDVARVPPREDFGHVPLPQVIGFGLDFRVGFQVERFVRTDEKEVDVLIRPARADFGAMAGHRFAVGPIIGEDAGHALPLRPVRVRRKREIGLGVLA